MTDVSTTPHSRLVMAPISTETTTQTQAPATLKLRPEGEAFPDLSTKGVSRARESGRGADGV